jgi:hypothetical protein
MSDVFYDIETKEMIDEHATDEEAAIRALHLSVGASWCKCHGARIFRAAHLLAEHLAEHPRIIGFNIVKFDNAVLSQARERSTREVYDAATGQYRLEKILPDSPRAIEKLLDAKSFDLQLDLEERVGFKVGLSALAAGTLRRAKTGSGAQAVVWNRIAARMLEQWSYALRDVGDAEGAQRVTELGAWFQERLEEYCAEDVNLVRLIWEYGVSNRRVAYIDFEGERRVVKVKWK